MYAEFFVFIFAEILNAISNDVSPLEFQKRSQQCLTLCKKLPYVSLKSQKSHYELF